MSLHSSDSPISADVNLYCDLTRLARLCPMAEAVGKAGLHGVQGCCDLCGEPCDPETQELNALDCTYAPKCPPDCAIYHQDCLERYLKTIRLEKCVLIPPSPHEGEHCVSPTGGLA